MKIDIKDLMSGFGIGLMFSEEFIVKAIGLLLCILVVLVYWVEVSNNKRKGKK